MASTLCGRPFDASYVAMNMGAHQAFTHSKLPGCVPNHYAQRGSMPLANVSQPTRQTWTWVNTPPIVHQPTINQQQQRSTNHAQSHTEILGGHEHEWSWFLAQPWYLDEPTAVRQMKHAAPSQKPRIEVRTTHWFRTACSSARARPPYFAAHREP